MQIPGSSFGSSNLGATNPEMSSLLSDTTDSMSGMSGAIQNIAGQTTSPQQEIQNQLALAQFTTQMDAESSIIEALSQAAQNAAKNAA